MLFLRFLYGIVIAVKTDRLSLCLALEGYAISFVNITHITHLKISYLEPQRRNLNPHFLYYIPISIKMPCTDTLNTSEHDCEISTVANTIGLNASKFIGDENMSGLLAVL